MKIMVSACMLGENCKYSGGNNRSEKVLEYIKGHEVFPICPEVMGGLPTPRVPADRPGAFSNAMMEMGATLCTPRNPSCLICPVRESCKGFAAGLAQELPRKPKKKAQRVERRAVLLVFCKDRVLIVKREEKLLQGLFVFPDVLHEGERGEPSALCAVLEGMRVLTAYDGYIGSAKHVFTHIIWEMDVHALIAENMPDVPGGQWVTADELESLPLPTAVKAARQWAMERLG